MAVTKCFPMIVGGLVVGVFGVWVEESLSIEGRQRQAAAAALPPLAPERRHGARDSRAQPARCALRVLQPCARHRDLARGAAPRAAIGQRRVGDHARPRSLQARQRSSRAPGRRRRPGAGGTGVAHHPPRFGSQGAVRRREFTHPVARHGLAAARRGRNTAQDTRTDPVAHRRAHATRHGEHGRDERGERGTRRDGRHRACRCGAAAPRSVPACNCVR
jgi:hypothetical protein